MSTLEIFSGVLLTLLTSGFILVFPYHVRKTESVSELTWRYLVPSLATSVTLLMYAGSVHKVPLILIGVVYLLANLDMMWLKWKDGRHRTPTANVMV